MQRFTARLVLLFVVLGTCEPFLRTLSGTPPHACCLRRMHTRLDGRPQFGAIAPRSNNCCPPLTTPQSATVADRDSASVLLHASDLQDGLPNSFHATRYSPNRSSRAPPDSPNA